jgi:hypothetical protein
MITYAMLARQIILPRPLAIKLTPLLPYSCSLPLARSQKSQLLCNQANPDSFCKIPGVGVPSTGSPWASALLLSISIALCFHNLTKPFSRNSHGFTSIRNPRGVTLYPMAKFMCRIPKSESFLCALCALCGEIPMFAGFKLFAACAHSDALPFFYAVRLE